jgi:hemerythrin-like domain-containing protein
VRALALWRATADRVSAAALFQVNGEPDPRAYAVTHTAIRWGAAMGSTQSSAAAGERHTTRDGFEILDACHRQMLTVLDTLSALVKHLGEHGEDEHARAMATEVVKFFNTTARQHHEDEERHIFPKIVVGSADPEMVQTVLRLQQDHRWLEEDWMELSAHLQALAAGQSWWDLDLLREGVEIFVALSHDHMALEESCIYPEARARMQTGERGEMGREMAARRRKKRSAASR